MVHWLLFVAMCAAALLLFADLALRRRSALAGAGRAAALLLQGAWLIQIAVIQYEGGRAGRCRGGWVGGRAGGRGRAMVHLLV